MPSRYQEGVKKTEELQELKEEEEQKRESPEEPAEVEETEEEEKEQRSRLETYTWIPNGFQVIHLLNRTKQKEMPFLGGSRSGGPQNSARH